MQDESILSALIEVTSKPGEDVFDGDPGAFTNFMGRASDEQELRRLADDAFGAMGFLVTDLSNLVVADAEGQPAEASAALARIAAGEPWAYTTFHVYPQDSE